MCQAEHNGKDSQKTKTKEGQNEHNGINSKNANFLNFQYWPKRLKQAN